MRAVFHTKENKWQLNYTWLPTWIGMNKSLMKELQVHLERTYEDKVGPLDEDAFEVEAHQVAVEWLQCAFPNIKGLKDYLNALSYVELQGPGV